jgi:hypothetical protein
MTKAAVNTTALGTEKYRIELGTLIEIRDLKYDSIKPWTVSHIGDSAQRAGNS